MLLLQDLLQVFVRSGWFTDFSNEVGTGSRSTTILTAFTSRSGGLIVIKVSSLVRKLLDFKKMKKVKEICVPDIVNCMKRLNSPEQIPL